MLFHVLIASLFLYLYRPFLKLTSFKRLKNDIPEGINGYHNLRKQETFPPDLPDQHSPDIRSCDPEDTADNLLYLLREEISMKSLRFFFQRIQAQILTAVFPTSG